MKEYHVTIRRSKGAGDEGLLQDYTVLIPEDEVVSVMNVLEYIYRKLDPTLAFFDHAACRQAACGKCAVRVNGKVRLACKETASETMLLEPATAKVVRDLVCES